MDILLRIVLLLLMQLGQMHKLEMMLERRYKLLKINMSQLQLQNKLLMMWLHLKFILKENNFDKMFGKNPRKVGEKIKKNAERWR